MADLYARQPSWTDYLPGNWQQTINTSPVVNALSRMLNKPTPDLEGAARRQYGPQDELGSIADKEWLERQAAGPSWLERNPSAADGVNKLGLLANFLGPGVKLPAAAPKPTGIRAYHGSPHDFNAERLVRYPDGRTEYVVGVPDRLPDIPKGAELVRDYPLGRFREDRLGTGEGAQAYGRGVAYVAESEGVARSYRDDLGGYDFGVKVPRRVVNDIDVAYDVEQALAQANGNPMRARQILEQNKQHFSGTGSDAMFDEALKLFDEIAPTLAPKPRGRMYEVNIKADPDQFLDWDKPLSQQPEGVKRTIEPALKAAALDLGKGASPEKIAQFEAMGLKNVADRMRPKEIDPWSLDTVTLAQQYPNALRDAGIPGIKYLDQQSRVAGQGSRNYVVFDDKLIEILRKYGLLPPVAAGTAAALNQQEPPP